MLQAQCHSSNTLMTVFQWCCRDETVRKKKVGAQNYVVPLWVLAYFETQTTLQTTLQKNRCCFICFLCLLCPLQISSPRRTLSRGSRIPGRLLGSTRRNRKGEREATRLPRGRGVTIMLKGIRRSLESTIKGSEREKVSFRRLCPSKIGILVALEKGCVARPPSSRDETRENRDRATELVGDERMRGTSTHRADRQSPPPPPSPLRMPSSRICSKSSKSTRPAWSASRRRATRCTRC